jgi:hypothetical protein
MMCPNCHAALSQVVSNWKYSENPSGTLSKPKETGWHHHCDPNNCYLATPVKGQL